MCSIFSGHISFREGKEWGEVYFGGTMVHHEEDRKDKNIVPHLDVLAWEEDNSGLK